MKRLILSTAAILLLSLACVVGGASAAGQPVNWTLGGSSEWSGSGFLADTFAIHGSVAGVGSYSGTLHAGPYFQTDTCGPECAFVTGSVDFVTRQGNFTGTVENGGLVTVISIGSGTTYTFTLTLDFAGGTRSFAHSHGAVSLSYASTQPTDQPGCAVCPIVDGGTLTGSISRDPSA